jgi:hypothetical protein
LNPDRFKFLRVRPMDTRSAAEKYTFGKEQVPVSCCGKCSTCGVEIEHARLEEVIREKYIPRKRRSFFKRLKDLLSTYRQY